MTGSGNALWMSRVERPVGKPVEVGMDIEDAYDLAKNPNQRQPSPDESGTCQCGDSECRFVTEAALRDHQRVERGSAPPECTMKVFRGILYALIPSIIIWALILWVLSGCTIPDEPRPMEGLTITVKVVSPAWITAEAAKPGSRVGNKAAVAFYDYQTCTAYLPANVSQAEFIRLLDHEVGRHGLGEQHDVDEHWSTLPIALRDAMQRLCVRKVS